jgi:hypothetical protein
MVSISGTSPTQLVVVESQETFLKGLVEMYVGYFDEVKADRVQGRNNYLVAGLVIPMDQIGPIEFMTALPAEIFGSREIVPETEFHADHIPAPQRQRKIAFGSK